MYRRFHIDYRANLLCAGSSAILLGAAHIHPELWFVSFLALIPFLWQLCSVGRKGAVALGAILATTYVFTTAAADLVAAPQTFLLKLLLLNVAFGLFGVAINGVSRQLRVNPLAIALLLLPLGCVLIQYTSPPDAFFASQVGSNLVIGFGSLLGILIWSGIIILGNSLILLFAKYVFRRLLRQSRVRPAGGRRRVVPAPVLPVGRQWLGVPHLRAPPLYPALT